VSHSLEIDSFEYEGRFFSMSVEYDVEWENDGIGSYEYWGAKGFDAGHDYAVVSDYSVADLTEHLPDGTEVSIPESDPLFAQVSKAVSDKVDKASESIEPDRDGEYDCERDRDEGRYDYD
jgi:hypothetical protein